MYKLNIIKKVIAVCIALMVAVSCNDWLDLEPQNALVVQEFWNNKEDVEAVLAAMYDEFRSAAEESFLYGELRADMLDFSRIAQKFSSYNQIAEGDITSSNSKVNWAPYYSTINLANTILQFAPGVREKDDKFTAEELAGYEAEAYFIRSLCYFYLVRTWKEVPYVVDATSSDTLDIFLPKLTERDVLQRVISDLKIAEEIAFVDHYSERQDLYRGRANVYAIQVLIADIYLWMEEYDQCISYCDKLINSGQYYLMDGTPFIWFEMYNPGNCGESVFEIQFNDKLPGQENDMHRELYKLISASENLEELLQVEDVRSMGTNGIMWKYSGVEYEILERNNSTERDANIIYYRYADVLLMKAEALGELGRFSEGVELLNELKQRAGIESADAPTVIDAYRNLILDERAREFAAEGKRWFDILRFAKRNNFENQKLVMDILLEGVDFKELPIRRAMVLDTMGYYLPIPERDILYNPNLEQNPFYLK